MAASGCLSLVVVLIALQEELDWRCYALYRVTDHDFCYRETTGKRLRPPSIKLGQRAFEILMARKMAAGDLETTWFERHGSTPITEIPTEWPEDYRQLVERRIALIETNRNIGLIEQPEYKRRWNTEPWDSQLVRALHNWLLNRLERYFDIDGRMNDDGTPTAAIDIALVSTARLADIARQDDDFMQVGALYRDDPAFDVDRLVAELVESESVPLLPILRYKAEGLSKRAAWEQTWNLQRLEDKLLEEEFLDLSSWNLDEEKRLAIANWQQAATSHLSTKNEALSTQNKEPSKILAIPVPPKYKSSDFQNSTYWRLRGKLDVPKERWVSFPHCESEDGALVIAWAGYDH